MTTTLVLLTLTLTTAPTALAHPRVTGISAEGKRIRTLVYRSDPCLARIIERETGGTWEVTLYNGFGHWHRGELMKKLSYGLPQSWPAEKLASAGPDWKTNWRTQLKWARDYAIERYGSACAALAFWLKNRWW